MEHLKESISVPAISQWCICGCVELGAIRKMKETDGQALAPQDSDPIWPRKHRHGHFSHGLVVIPSGNNMGSLTPRLSCSSLPRLCCFEDEEVIYYNEGAGVISKRSPQKDRKFPEVSSAGEFMLKHYCGI
eukprot:Seg834.1 transcript_id=Seg834.1/GoldUCD/mRNA.D3Y31 product="hypothetical protein" protein_id=Seg834.1/GoldUCD/D3Y31